MEILAATRRSVIRNFVFQGGATLSTYLGSLALMPLVLKLSGAGVYGTYVLWGSVISLTTMLMNLGTGYKARRALPSLQSQEDRAAEFMSVASIQLITSGLAISVLLTITPFLNAHLFRGEGALHPAVIPIFVFSIYLNSVPDLFFRSTHRIGLLSAVQVPRALLLPILVLLHVLAGGTPSLNSLLLSQAAAFWIFGGYLWWRIVSEIGRRFRFGTLAYYIEDIKLGLPLVSATFVETVLASSDRYVLAAYLSPKQVGIYATATAVGSFALFFPRVASAVLLPALSRLIDGGNRQQAQLLLDRTLKSFLGIGIPFVAGAAIMAMPILNFLATPEIAERGRFVVPLIAISTLLYGCMYIAYNAAFVMKKTGLWLQANIVALFVSISLNVVLLYFFRRLEVVAVTAIICYASSMTMIYRALMNIWVIHIELSFLVRISFATAIMSVVLLLGLEVLHATSPALIVIGALVPLGMLTYAIAVTVLGVIGRKELGELKRSFLT